MSSRPWRPWSTPPRAANEVEGFFFFSYVPTFGGNQSPKRQLRDRQHVYDDYTADDTVDFDS